jgi:ferrous iron transport protein B
VIFGRLTGRYVTVSNYPGTTVAVTKGRALLGAEVADVIDTPGVNTLEGAISEDERITRDVVVGADTDLIIQIADARNIRRALMLTAQLAQCGKPMVLALNMVDEAFARGVAVSAEALASALRIPVVEMVAVEGRGFSELRDALASAARPDVPAQPHANARAVWAHELTERVRRVSTLSLAYVQEALARATRRPATGLPILAAVLYALYLFVGVFGAQTLVKLLEDDVFGRAINPAATFLIDRFVPVPLVRDFLVGEYGLITMGVTYSIAILLPVVATFFLMFGFLEDSGYIPRLAIFCDRTFRIMGLNGKAVLPMVLGLGCDTMATMTTRILGDAEGAADRDPAARARHPLLGAARDDHGHPRRCLLRRARHPVRRRTLSDAAGRLAGGARADWRAIRIRSRTAADSPAECRYEAICGGCRARAYAATSSFLAEEPFCTYRPDLDQRKVDPLTLHPAAH